MTAQIVQINVKPQTGSERGIPKIAVPKAEVTCAGIVGDFNRYRTADLESSEHMAVSLLPIEVIEALSAEGWPVEPGHLGENFTMRGISCDQFAIGQKYRLGEVEIELTEEIKPCRNLYVLPYVGVQRGPELLEALVDRRGWYARVLREGMIRAEDGVERVGE